MFGTSPLKVRMEQIYEGSNVACHGLVEGALEIVRFDHAPRLHQTVSQLFVDFELVRHGWRDGREDLGLEIGVRPCVVEERHTGGRLG